MKEYGNFEELLQNQKSSEKNILVTGVTGFLGSNFLYWRMQLPGKIFVLVRAKSLSEGNARVLSVLKEAANSYGIELPEQEVLEQKVHCILGDLSEEKCGISEQQITLLKESNISEVWHCAANMAFLDKDREWLKKTNVFGSESLVDIGQACNIKRFIYVSTAYTTRTSKGFVAEELHAREADGKYGNNYEESKDLAEQIIVKRCEKHGLDWTILRPSMVMGPVASKRSGATKFGVYGFGRSLHINREVFASLESKLRLVVSDDSTSNLIAVDQVVFDMLYVDSINFGDKNVYHLSNPINISMRDGISTVEKNIGTDAIEFVNQRDTPPTPIERLMDEGSQFVQTYFTRDLVFERSLPHHHQEYNLDVLNECMENYYHELKNEQANSDFTPHTITSFDGLDLAVYARGSRKKPPLIFINAYGMPIDFAASIGRRLSTYFHFITWDSRWVPDLNQEFELEKCDSSTHAKDLISILDHFDIESCVLVGWSSGVQVCLRTMSEYQDRIKFGVLLNGGVSLETGKSVRETNYQKSLRSLFPKMAKSRAAAKLYCDLIYGDKSKGHAIEENMIGSMLTNLDSELMDMTSAPFKNAESVYRYSNMMYRNFEEQKDAFTSNIKLPVLVYGSEVDEVTHPDVARELAERLPRSTLHISPTATHFAQYSDPDVAEMIIKYAFALKNNKLAS